jgi:porphobilinogen deaminase
MMLRIGTRGSDLALMQTRLVCSLITQQSSAHYI